MLSDLIVIDMTRALAGPHAGMMLADLGARVIKFEPPQGDDTRGWGPPFVGSEGDPVSTYFLSCNRNKESVVGDLKTDAGRELFEHLVCRADVLLENFRTGVLDRLGFSVERLHELNPRLVITSITGFGHDGPEGHRPGYDQILQGEAGLMSITGDEHGEPTKAGVPIADLLAGLNATVGTLGALYERVNTNRGKVVRVSLLSSIVGVHAFQGTRWTVAGEEPGRIGNHHPSISPYGLFRAADSLVQVAVGSQSQWRNFAEFIGVDPDSPDFADNPARVGNRELLTEAVNLAFSRMSADAVLAEMDRIGVPAGRVRSLSEVYDWEQVHSQGLVIDVQHPTLGPISLPGPAIRFDGHDGAGARGQHIAPPALGAHTEEVWRWLKGEDDRSCAAARTEARRPESAGRLTDAP
ncbi:crotonobetainyl-CoA:carnitine CoA-transferase CaiB-like acyl-CoA transferase [Nocardioides sp. J9]|uniref:CaiB/BaiF CoA transferase family protein n=1 Tax=Nocardioides sp. J9 TaxID=935844 RepID=UPI00119F1D16|nr:CoA transferase [Nocardioides sp. J9]TWH01736.1 crotonobetainyl-CoA:carnitine CoA-transferase CaiB-like acyl-CoA transferase [Nocardioides sp. J9]